MKKVFHSFYKNKLLYVVFWVIINIVLTRPVQVFAALAHENPLKANTIAEFIEDLAEVAFQFGIPVAVMFILYGGYLFVTARGNPEQLNQAKRVFLWAIAGTALLVGAIILAEAIVNTVRTF